MGVKYNCQGPQDFLRFNTVGVDQTLKPIKVFKCWPPQIFEPSSGTDAYIHILLKFLGKTYNKCTSDHSANEVEWCATNVKQDGEVIDGQWGDCDKESITCIDIPAGAAKRPPPQQQRPRPQGLPPGFPPQGFPPRRPPPSGNGQNRPPPRIPNGPPPRSFPQNGPPRNNQPAPQPKSALPQEFRFDPNNILALALSGKIAGLGGVSGTPGSQKPEETFEFSEELRNSLKTFWDDEAWPAMWYLNRGGKGMDMNVEDAWAQGTVGSIKFCYVI